MRIAPRDRYYALKFSEQYARDYKQFVTDKGEEYFPLHGSPADLPISLSASAKEFCRIYKLRYPIDPKEPPHDWEVDFAFPPISYLDSPESWRDIKYAPIGEQEKVISHVNGKLTIMVDEGYSRDEIKEAFESFLAMEYDYKFDKTKKRVRESSLDIWEVYRRRKIEGETLKEITRIIYKIDELPDWNTQEESFQKNVERAFDKAKSIITTIEAFAKSRQ